jgi:hypothetical protein
MKFEFKSLSIYEEEAIPNFMGESNINWVVREFDSMTQAIECVNANHGFMITDDGERAFVVRNIKLVK